MECSKLSRKRRSIYKEELNATLDELMNEDPNEENLAELVNVKLALNVEADKEKLY